MVQLETKKTRVSDAGVKGRGVFATQEIFSCEVIEKAPLLLIEGNLECQLISLTKLSDYVYDVSYENLEGETVDAVAIGLGHTSMYNTCDSNEPNATFDINFSYHQITISALRHIKAGEEITIAYRNIEDDTREGLVVLAEDASSIKIEAEKGGLEQQVLDDILKIQEEVHRVTSKHFPE